MDVSTHTSWGGRGKRGAVPAIALEAPSAKRRRVQVLPSWMQAPSFDIAFDIATTASRKCPWASCQCAVGLRKLGLRRRGCNSTTMHPGRRGGGAWWTPGMQTVRMRSFLWPLWPMRQPICRCRRCRSWPPGSWSPSSTTWPRRRQSRPLLCATGPSAPANRPLEQTCVSLLCNVVVAANKLARCSLTTSSCVRFRVVRAYQAEHAWTC